MIIRMDFCRHKGYNKYSSEKKRCYKMFTVVYIAVFALLAVELYPIVKKVMQK